MTFLLVEPRAVEAALGGTGSFHRGRTFSELQVIDEDVRDAHRQLVEIFDGDPCPGASEVLERFVRAAFRHTEGDRPTVPATGCERSVKLARAFIERHFAARITLDDIAAAAGVSKFHLARGFNDRVGLPLYRYLKAVRVGRALALLRKGLRPADVVGLAGFVDQPHITRVFRRELGITPGRYREGLASAAPDPEDDDHLEEAKPTPPRRLSRASR
jgi:AraC-like DNA-binding protein